LRDRITMGLHQASLAVCVSNAVAVDLLTDGVTERHVKVIHNGVSTLRIAVGDALQLRKELGIPADAVVVTQVGSLIPRKGWDLLLRAIALLDGESPPLALLVVGDGPERGELVRSVEAQGLADRVYVLGERRDAGAIYRDATDIAVLASREEAFGLSLLEAAALGVPGVGFRIGGIPEVVEDGITGLLVSPEDPEALAAALRTLATDAELRRRMGDAARERALSLFSVEQNAASFHSAYEELLACPAAQFGWRGAWTSPAVYTRAAAAVLGRRLGRLRSGWASNSP
jgi:glycosyltransferase involved in cell wall biosynthesis